MNVTITLVPGQHRTECGSERGTEHYPGCVFGAIVSALAPLLEPEP